MALFGQTIAITFRAFNALSSDTDSNLKARGSEIGLCSAPLPDGSQKHAGVHPRPYAEAQIAFGPHDAFASMTLRAQLALEASCTHFPLLGSQPPVRQTPSSKTCCCAVPEQAWPTTGR